MDFFDRQEKTRRRTGVLLVYFTAAIAITASLNYFVVMVIWFFLSSKTSGGYESLPPFDWWRAPVFLAAFLVTMGVVVIGSLYKISDLRRGGSRVAELLGGTLVPPNARDFYERRLLNVVEEMAIASGMTVPPVYVLARQKGINAFAAGYAPRDAVVTVTYGTMVGLTRDELQGVIAHEFSHILNGDMRLNIHLMGGLHGLLLIALAGRSVFELRLRGRGSLYLYLAAGMLFVIGSIGLFFGKLIKSAISRQREFLADAAAVQFTRNPAGLTGALKKIGGLPGGSRIRSAYAEDVSHMFFGNALRFDSLATHPPLADRVAWLDPGFGGTFETLSWDSVYKEVEGKERPSSQKKNPSLVDVLTRPADLAVAGAVLQGAGRRPPAKEKIPRRNPEELMASIGAPMQEHVTAAERLIKSIPPRILEMARDPYGVRAVIYLLLLDPSETVREKQITALRERADEKVVEELEKTLSMLAEITPEMRLPIVDLAVPALRQLSQDQYILFRVNLRPLVDADGVISIFEYALQRVLTCVLDPLFCGGRQRPASVYAFRGVQKEISCVLSVLARLSSDPQEAFNRAAGEIPDNSAQFTLLPEADCGWEPLDAVLDRLTGASFYIKKWMLASALVCLMHDREITVEEVEMFRAIADSLDCPVPPWLTVASLDV